MPSTTIPPTRLAIHSCWESSTPVGFLYRHSINHPWGVMLVATLLVLAVAPGVAQLTLRTDGHALIPTEAAEIRLDASIRQEFGTNDVLVVLIRTKHIDGLFNPQTVELVQNLSRKIANKLDLGPANISSLETEHTDRVRTGSLKFRGFLEPLPQSLEELERLRGDLAAIQLFNGTLVSADGQGTSILVGVPEGIDRVAFFSSIRDIISETDVGADSVRLIGAPVAEALLGTHILEDLGVPAGLLGYQTMTPPGEDRWTLPVSTYEFKLFIARNFGLVPVAIAVMVMVFLIAFRSLPAAMLPLAEVGACLAFVFGLMGWVGVPIYLTVAVLPIILTAIGVADEIHIFSRYAEELRTGRWDDHRQAVLTSMEEMWKPVVKTSVTTSVGFCSFLLSPIEAVRMFGLFAVVGILFCMFWSLTVIPALLAVCPPKWLVPAKRIGRGTDPAARASFFGRLGSGVIRVRYLVGAAALGIGVFAWFGAERVFVQDSWIDGFAPETDFFQASMLFNKEFLGSHILLVEADADKGTVSGQIDSEAVTLRGIEIPRSGIDDPGALVGRSVYVWRTNQSRGNVSGKDMAHFRNEWTAPIESVELVGDRITILTQRRKGSPEFALRLADGIPVSYEIAALPFLDPLILAAIDALETFIEAQTDKMVGGVIGPANLLKTTHFMVMARKEGSRRLPDTRERTDMTWNRYQHVRGKPRLHQAVNAAFTKGLITVYMTNANFVDVGALMQSIREYEAEHLKPLGIRLAFAGDVAVSQTLIEAIVDTQVRSLLLSLAGIVALTALLGRSLRWGFLSVLPCALAVLINFAMMGYWGMPLGVATSMFAGMTLGIGVDYAIHLLERFRLDRSAGMDPDQAIISAMKFTGPPILIDALGVALGFGVMTLSQVPANARLGALLILSIIGCCATSLLVLPAILRMIAPRTVKSTAR